MNPSESEDLSLQGLDIPHEEWGCSEEHPCPRCRAMAEILAL